MAKRKSDNVFGDIDERYFLNPESVSKHLFCSICQEVFTDPQRAPCGHSYCKQCILPWLKQSKSCPEDRKSLHPHQLHHDFILENIVGDQQVACSFRRLGCDYVGPLQMQAHHKKLCTFNPANVPDFLKKDLQETASKSSSINDSACESESEDSVLPSVAAPSLKMRLFSAGNERRELLCSMFEENEKKTIEKSSHNLKDNTCSQRKRKRKS